MPIEVIQLIKQMDNNDNEVIDFEELDSYLRGSAESCECPRGALHPCIVLRTLK